MIPANQLQWNEWQKQPMGQFFVLPQKFPNGLCITWLALALNQVHDSVTITLIKVLKEELKCS